MNLLFGRDSEVAAWVATQIAHADDFGPCAALGVVDHDGIVAGCVYHNWIPSYGDCHISFAATSARWATRGMIRALLGVPFIQYGARRVTMVTPHDNVRAQRVMRGIGFVREGCLRHFYARKRHAMVYGLLAAEFEALCRRYSREVKHGQECTERADAA